jgi:NADP-dependent aldehyde dehydrogenase
MYQIEEELKNIEIVMSRSLSAFRQYKKVKPEKRAFFLEQVAEVIDSKREVLVSLAIEESHLPAGRLNGELSRTIHQLKMFAQLVREGSWVEASIDTGDTIRLPLPKPDLRKMLVPIGPVVVFGASNFPFAFSTAGGDTASALASGSSVVIKGHPGHPKTSTAMFSAIHEAVLSAGLPEYTVQHVDGTSFELGKALVIHPYTAGIGFTGSYKGGIALLNYAKERKNPIPVFAEMSSINPVIFYPEALRLNALKLAETYAASITAGVGQFCTNPGLLLAIEGEELDTFERALAAAIRQVQPQQMLHEGIQQAYSKGLDFVLRQKQVDIVARSEKLPGVLEGYPTVVKTTAAVFKENPHLREELFGPYSLLVVCQNKEDLINVLQLVSGQLTTTLMATEKDMTEYGDILEIQQSLAGRIIVNDVPTGVEVCNSMVHGGPFPATTDGRFTSVGAFAIKRWVRPVSFQGFPQQFLPDELKDENPLKIWRWVDNQWKR